MAGATFEKLFWGSICGLIALMLILSLDFELGFDQIIFFMAGQALLEHQAIYSQVFDIKPPPIFLIYASAIAVFGDYEFAPRAMEAVFMLVTAGLLVAIARHLAAWRMGLLIFAVYYLCIFGGGYWNTGQVETFAAPFFALGGLLLVAGLHSRQSFNVYLVLCAAFLVFPALMKPTLGGSLIAAFLSAVFYFRAWCSFRLFLSLTGAFLLGSLCMTLAFLAAMEVFFGATSEYLRGMATALQHYAAGTQTFMDSFIRALRAGVHDRFLMVTAFIWVPFIFLRKDRFRMAIALFLLVSLLIQLVGVAVQGRNFIYHYAGAILPAACSSGWGIWLLFSYLWQWKSWLPVLLAGLVVVGVMGRPLYGVFYMTAVRAERVVFGHEEPVWGSIRWPTNNWLEQASAVADKFDLEQEPVLIWAFRAPFLYFHGRDRFYPATRFIFSQHLRLMPDGTPLHAQMMEDLASSNPRVILVARQDEDLSIAPGTPNSDVHVRERFAALREMIERDFAAAPDFEGFAVYLRRAP